VTGWGTDGQEVRWHATDWAARILQHEVDHLDGKLYVDCAEPGTQVKVSPPSWTSAEKKGAVGLLLVVAAATLVARWRARPKVRAATPGQ